MTSTMRKKFRFYLFFTK